MQFIKISEQSKELLYTIANSDNPAQLLCDRLEKASSEERIQINESIRELIQAHYIDVKWANNKPYIVKINIEGRNYEERLLDYELSKDSKVIHINNNSITIGNNNKITNSSIGNKEEKKPESAETKKKFYEKHPWISGIIISIIAGAILLFSFWKEIIMRLEGLFNG